MPIEAKRISEYATTRLNGFVSKHKGPMTESDWGRYVNAAEIGGINDSSRRSHGGSFIRGIRSAQQNRYNKEDSGLLEAMNMGGKVRRYNRGGMVPGYARGGRVAANLLPIAATFGAEPAGRKIGSMLDGESGASIGSSIGSGVMMASWILPTILQFKGLNKEVEGSIGKFAKLKNALSMSFIPPQAKIAAAILIGTGIALKKYNDDLQETAKLNRLAFSGAVKPVEEFDTKLKDIRKSITATRQTYDLFIASNTKIGVTGIQLTVTEFKALQETVKKTYPDIVKLLNQTPYNKLADTVANLKAQFIAAGDSAEKATQETYALLTVSDRAGSARSIITSEQVKNVNDMDSAIQTMLRTLSTAQQSGGAKGFGASLTGTFTAMDSSYDSLVKSKDAATALKTQFDAINNSRSKNLKLTQQQISHFLVFLAITL
jgi:hypothetical protein